MLVDDRFQSNIESEDPEKWLPIQILNAVWSTPTLPEETQVEVMKVKCLFGAWNEKKLW